MQKLIFALKFHRPARSNKDEIDDMPAIAESVLFIEPDGVDIKLVPAVMTNEAKMTDDTHFSEDGKITFGGEANTLNFSSIGVGTVLSGPDDEGFSHGIVMWQIDSGKGAGIFEKATGAITSNFLINLVTNELIDYHFYIVYLAQ